MRRHAPNPNPYPTPSPNLTLALALALTLPLTLTLTLPLTLTLTPTLTRCGAVTRPSQRSAGSPSGGGRFDPDDHAGPTATHSDAAAAHPGPTATHADAAAPDAGTRARSDAALPAHRRGGGDNQRLDARKAAVDLPAPASINGGGPLRRRAVLAAERAAERVQAAARPDPNPTLTLTLTLSLTLTPTPTPTPIPKP